jgi:hypothetical protein
MTETNLISQWRFRAFWIAGRFPFPQVLSQLLSQLRLPWVKNASCLNRKRGCVCFVHFFRRKRHNSVAVEISFLIRSQGSRGGNPGLEAVALLGH